MKKISDFILILLIGAAIATVVFECFAFAQYSMTPAQWSLEVRTACAFALAVIGIITILFAVIKSHDL